jgi:hypothetical protein
LPQSLTVQFALPNIPRSICIALSIPTAVFWTGTLYYSSLLTCYSSATPFRSSCYLLGQNCTILHLPFLKYIRIALYCQSQCKIVLQYTMPQFTLPRKYLLNTKYTTHKNSKLYFILESIGGRSSYQHKVSDTTNTWIMGSTHAA